MIKKKILISLTPFLLTNLYSNEVQEYKEPTKEINHNKEDKNKDLEQRIQDMKKKEQIKELYSNVKDPEFRKQEMERMKDPEFRKQEMEKMKDPEFRKQEMEKMKDPEFRKQEMERMKDPEFRKQEMERMKDPEFKNNPEIKKKELSQEELEKKIESLTKTINDLQKNNNSYENLEKLLTGENVSNKVIDPSGLVKEEEKSETLLPEPIKIAKIGDKITLFVKYKILIDKDNKVFEEKIIKINKGFEIEDWELTKIERDSIEYTNKKENKKIIKYFNKATN